MWPRKLRGARTLVVDGHKVVWRLEMGVPDSRIVVRSYGQPSSCLTVILSQRADPWLTMGATGNMGAALGAITPSFVAGAIRRAFDRGWSPAAPKSVLTFRHSE